MHYSYKVRTEHPSPNICGVILQYSLSQQTVHHLISTLLIRGQDSGRTVSSLYEGLFLAVAPNMFIRMIDDRR